MERLTIERRQRQALPKFIVTDGLRQRFVDGHAQRDAQLLALRQQRRPKITDDDADRLARAADRQAAKRARRLAAALAGGMICVG